MGILEKSAFAPRDPTRRGRERRNLPSPTSTDLERFAGGVSGGIAAKPRMLILESFRWHSRARDSIGVVANAFRRAKVGAARRRSNDARVRLRLVVA